MRRGRIRRIAFWIVVPIVVLLAGLGGLYYAFMTKFKPNPPACASSTNADALQQQREDTDCFRKLIALDRSYSPQARAEAARQLYAIAGMRTALSRPAFRAALMRVAALADNGHTSLFSAEHPNGRPRLLSIRVVEFTDGIYVMRAPKEDADILAARVVAIDGVPIEKAIAKIGQYRGGTEAFRRDFAVSMLDATDITNGVGISPSPDHATWTFQTADGHRVQRSFSAYQPSYAEERPNLWRWMSPQPVAGGEHGWLAAKPDAPIPLAFGDGDRLFRRAWIDNGCILYLQLRANQGNDKEDIGAFLNATEAELKTRHPCAVIFDLRFDGGGDYTNTAGFARGLPALLAPGAHTYLLTSVDTFSAGITTTVFVKQAMPAAQVTMLGEHVGDRIIFWAEGGSGCLPHAPFCFHYATGMHDYLHGCREWSDCYWVNRIYPAVTPTLDPDERIEMRFADWKAGRDPVFDRALQLARAQAKVATRTP